MLHDPLLMVSHSTGSRWDLIQAGGGNTSVKSEDGIMRIKASGCSLSEMGQPGTIAQVQYQPIREFLIENLNQTETLEKHAKEILTRYTLKGSPRPSIEVWLHALADIVTIHSHALAAMLHLNQADWEKRIQAFLPQAIAVPYITPGIGLAQAMGLAMNQESPPGLVLFQNHGLLVSARSAEDALKLQNQALSALASPLHLDLSAWEICQEILAGCQGQIQGVWLCEDQRIRQILQEQPEALDAPWCCPDVQVYVGFSIPRTTRNSIPSTLNAYREEFGEFPKALLVEDQIYTLGKSVKKARETEELLKFQLLATALAPGTVVGITPEEQRFLAGWEAEKYRQQRN